MPKSEVLNSEKILSNVGESQSAVKISLYVLNDSAYLIPLLTLICEKSSSGDNKN